MADESWKLDYVNSAFYLDNRGNPVNGYEVGITLLPFNAAISFNVPTDDPETIAKMAQQRLNNRIALEKMSGNNQG